MLPGGRVGSTGARKAQGRSSEARESGGEAGAGRGRRRASWEVSVPATQDCRGFGRHGWDRGAPSPAHASVRLGMRAAWGARGLGLRHGQAQGRPAVRQASATHPPRTRHPTPGDARTTPGPRPDHARTTRRPRPHTRHSPATHPPPTRHSPAARPPLIRHSPATHPPPARQTTAAAATGCSGDGARPWASGPRSWAKAGSAEEAGAASRGYGVRPRGCQLRQRPGADALAPLRTLSRPSVAHLQAWTSEADGSACEDIDAPPACMSGVAGVASGRVCCMQVWTRSPGRDCQVLRVASRPPCQAPG